MAEGKTNIISIEENNSQITQTKNNGNNISITDTVKNIKETTEQLKTVIQDLTHKASQNNFTQEELDNIYILFNSMSEELTKTNHNITQSKIDML